MANLKEIRNRIASVSSTMQITSAMKMVSAAKLKKAQDAITAMRPYSDKLTELIQNLSHSIDGDTPNPYTQERPVKKVLLVAITSNRGLCGGFNSNIIKAVNQYVEQNSKQEVRLITLGKKGNDILSKSNTIISNDNGIFDDLSFANASKIAEGFMDAFANKEYDKVVVIYNRFKNAATQIITTETLLPIVAEAKENSSTIADYIFEPTQEEIVNELLPKSIKMQLFKALRDSFASEHGARMTAMHKATDNATELRDQLKLTYNKARQAAITNEILEIVGGAEALNN
ncbi:ATP synthase F1 subunit gamma [Flavobacteriaceae bacterium]|nr:ATP synthase F1 subunit gamma [Flavobacteriaceae bacterium]